VRKLEPLSSPSAIRHSPMTESGAGSAALDRVQPSAPDTPGAARYSTEDEYGL